MHLRHDNSVSTPFWSHNIGFCLYLCVWVAFIMPQLETEHENFLSKPLELPTINHPVIYAVKNELLNNLRAWSLDFSMVVFLVTFFFWT